MGIGALRDLIAEKDTDIFGVTATVTLKYEEPIVTTGIWSAPDVDDRPVGGEFERLAPKRIMSFAKSDVPTIPRGTIVEAPGQDGDPTVKTWEVDATDTSLTMHWRVVLVEVDC